jgi:hypothetical protein
LSAPGIPDRISIDERKGKQIPALCALKSEFEPSMTIRQGSIGIFSPMGIQIQEKFTGFDAVGRYFYGVIVLKK